MGRALQNLGRWRELQLMYERVWGGEGLPKKRKKGDLRDSLEKGKYLANSYNAATVNVNYKLSSFSQCYFKNGTEILMTVWEFFSRNHFLRGDFIFP